MISVSKSIQYKLEYSRWSATAVTTRKIMTPSVLLKAKCYFGALHLIKRPYYLQTNAPKGPSS